MSLGCISCTSAADAGYYNGTALSTTVATGSSQTINFSAGFSSTAYTKYWKVYIDYNQNGVFTDVGKLIVSGSSSSAGTLTSTFTVPTTAKTGSTRLRVIRSDASATTSCSSYSYGKTEDYTLKISGGTAIVAMLATLTGSPPGNKVAQALQLYPKSATDTLHLVLPGRATATSVQVTDVRGARRAGPYAEGTLDVSALANGALYPHR